MSQSREDVIRGLYAAFGRGDLPAVLAMVDDDIDWHAPESLPHGGEVRGREALGGFFRGIGARWESLVVELEALVSGGDRVLALARARGRLRVTDEEFEYAAAHAWTFRGETPVRFDEYVNAPVSLPAAHAVARCERV